MSLTTGLVAVLNFNETTGTSAADATGNGHTGTLSGTVPTWVSGKIGNAINCLGGAGGATSSYVAVPTHADFNMGTGDFTYSFWFDKTNTGFFGLFDTGYSAAQSLLCECDTAANKIRLYISSVLRFTGTPNFSNSTWYYVVIRRIGTTLEVFINDTSLGTVVNSEAISCPAANLSIGRYGGGGENLNGKMEMFEVRKGYGLSNAEKSQLYNGGAGLQYPYTSSSNTGNFFNFF